MGLLNTELYKKYSTPDTKWIWVELPKCGKCGKSTNLRARQEDVDTYQKGVKAIQLCFPYWTSHERDCLVLGFCQSCQDVLGI